ncbi:Ig-like domain-containing protein [Flavobacterium hauense]
MKKIFTLLILLTAGYTNAQTIVPEIEWEKSLGSESNDGAAGVTVTADGGYIVFGNVFDLSGNVTAHYGTSDYWIAKLDAAGVLEWEKTYGGTSFEGAAASGLKVDTSKIRQTPDGGYILGANSSSNDIDVSDNFGESDVWLVKIDNIGNIEWERNYGNEQEDAFFDIRVTSDGGYIMTSGTSDMDTFVFGTKITKLDVLGNVEWSNAYQGTGQFTFSHLLNIIQTSDGGYIATGWTNAESSATIPGHEILPGFFDPNGRLWVLKINATGVFEWAKTYGGSNLEEGYSIVETADGNFVVGGMTYSGDGDAVGHPDPDNAPSQWVLKLDNTGDIIWQKTYGNRGSVNDVKIMPDGNYVVGGSYIINIKSTNGEVINGRGGTDEFLMKLNQQTGDIIWTKTMGGSLNDNLWGFALAPDGGFITIGSSWSVDGDISANIGGFDYWVVKLGPDCVVPVLTAQTAYTVCSDTEFTLTAASDGNTINWYSSKTATDILFTGPDFVIPALTEGVSYWVGAISPTGCNSQRTEVVITVNTRPDLTVENNAVSICETTEVTLTASSSAGNSILWYDSAEATDSIASGENFTTPILTATTSYWVQSNNLLTNCVSDRIEITVTVTPLPVVTTNTTISICEGTQAVLKADTQQGTLIAWYDSEDAIESIASGSEFTTPVLTEETSYWVQVSNPQTNCVSNRAEITIKVNPVSLAVVEFSYVDPVCILADNPVPVVADNFTWGGTFSSTSGVTINAETGEINVKASQPGLYVVRYTVEEDLDSCLAFAQFETEVIIDICQIQRGISPNGDNMNDWFDLTGLDVHHLIIYNRYGKDVYSRSGYVKEWGGQDKDGKELPDGTYFYAIEKTDGTMHTGWIYINRNH